MAQQKYIYIDESGEIDFFGKKKRALWTEPDFKPFTLLGMVVTSDGKRLRKEVEKLRMTIMENPLFNQIYSVKTNPNYFIHARTDHSDIKVKVFEFIQSLDYIDFYVVIARKIPELFMNKHHSKTHEFYFDLVNKLISRLELNTENEYKMYLAQRQSSTEQRFVESVEKVIKKQFLDEKIIYKCDIVKSSEYPALSMVDYALWAVHRYIDQGDKRFLMAIEDKFKVIYDVYDEAAENNIYTKENLFDLAKASPFKIKKV